MKSVMGRCAGAALAMASLAGTVALAVPGGAGAAVSGSPNWATIQQQAFQAVQSYRGDGTVTAVATPTATGSSSFTGPGGSSVSTAERSVEVSDSGGTALVGMSVLGNSQLIVTLTDLSNGGATTYLVTSPGTATVSGAYSAPVSTQRGVEPLGSESEGIIRPDVSGSCGTGTSGPSVISSGYGPLIAGSAYISCSAPNNLAVQVGLYEWTGSSSTSLNDIQGSSGSSVYGVSATTYAPCHSSATYNDFAANALYSIDGSITSGGSGWIGLLCALL